MLKTRICACIAVLLYTGICNARIINVPGDGLTIQSGINSASSGDTVLVAPGTYFEQIKLKEGVTLLGSGANISIIDDSGFPDIAAIRGKKNTEVNGFTIIGHRIGIYNWDCNTNIKNNIIIGRYRGVESSSNRQNILNNIITGSLDYAIHNTICGPLISNNIITGNYGGIIDNYGYSRILNNSIVNNNYGIYCYGSYSNFTNNIISNNCQYGVYNIYSRPSYTYNDIWGNGIDMYNRYSYPTLSNNISFDPIYIDPNAGDFHLRFNSPCIDAGDNYASGLLELDYDGNSRIVDGNGDAIAVVDMGAFEYFCPNSPPMAVVNGPYLGYINQLISFDASVSSDPDEDSLQYRWDFDGNGTWDTDWSYSPVEEFGYSTSFSGVAFVEVSDGELTDTAAAFVTVITAQDGAAAINENIQELPDEAFDRNPAQRKNAMSNKIDALITMIDDAEALIDAGLYQEAIDKLEHDIRPKMDGSLGGNPRNDWVIDPVAQAELCSMVDGLIAYLEDVIEGLARRLAEKRILKPLGMYLNAYPNPFNASIRIDTAPEAEANIFNIKGQLVDMLPGGISLWVPDDNLAVGVYLIRASLNNETMKRRVIFLK